MRHKKLLSTLIFLLCIAFSIPGYTGGYLQGKIVKVSDGDTVWVRLKNGNRVKVRIWGIDTPEKFRSRKLYRSAEACGVPVEEEVRLGKLASKKARELLDHSSVVIETHGRGYYGRLLGRILIKGKEDFGLEMILSGYSCIYRRSAPREYRQAQEEARENRQGLWKVDYELMDCLCYPNFNPRN